MDTIYFTKSQEDIQKAAEIIKAGGLVAFPTETVYGLGADALNKEAVEKVYKAKGRPSDNPMIVHIAKIQDVPRLSDQSSPQLQKLAEAFWPGPLTMVLKAKATVPRTTTGGLDTVAIRMPNSKETLKLIEKSGCCLAGPSANLSGSPSPTTYLHVKADLDGRIDGIIMGDDSAVGIESTVLDLTGEEPQILRPGYITREMLEMVLQRPVSYDPTLFKNPKDLGESFHPKAPGMKYKHYAPKAEMVIYQGEAAKVKAEIIREEARLLKQGKRVETLIYESPKEAAQNLFADLREADRKKVDVILAAALEEKELGISVMNRMFKSAGYNIKKV